MGKRIRSVARISPNYVDFELSRQRPGAAARRTLEINDTATEERAARRLTSALSTHRGAGLEIANLVVSERRTLSDAWKTAPRSAIVLHRAFRRIPLGLRNKLDVHYSRLKRQSADGRVSVQSLFEAIAVGAQPFTGGTVMGYVKLYVAKNAKPRIAPHLETIFERQVIKLEQRAENGRASVRDLTTSAIGDDLVTDRRIMVFEQAGRYLDWRYADAGTVDAS